MKVGAAAAGSGNGGAPAARRKPGASPRAWLMVLAVVIVTAGGAAFVLLRRPTTRHPTLPPTPPQAQGSPEFNRRLNEAESRARNAATAAQGIADLGKLYHATGFIAEAEVCWKLLRQLQPHEGRWSYYLADLRRTAADMAGLKAELEQTVELSPSYAPAWLELAELNFKNGNLPAAGTAYRRRLALIPDDPYASLGLARLQLQQGRNEDGRKRIEALVQATPDFSSAQNVLAEMLAKEGNVKAAANHRWAGTVAGRFRTAADPWKEELQEACYDPEQLMVWGAIDLQTKQRDWGRAFFERAVKLAPENARTYENLGLFHVAKGETARACAVMEAGIKRPRPSERLFVSLGNAYRTLRQPNDTMRIVELGLAAIPDSAELENLRGLGLTDLGRIEEAVAAFRTAIERAPSAPDPTANLGLTLLQQGQREEGVALLKRALELQPMFTKALTRLARLELEAGHTDAAAAYIFPYFQQFPGLSSARELMGLYYLRKAVLAAQRGDSTGAIESCQTGLTIVPEAAELHGFLGVQQLQRRRLPEARAELETARTLRPTDARILLYLGQVLFESGERDEARRVLTEAAEQSRARGDTTLTAQCEAALRTVGP